MRWGNTVSGEQGERVKKVIVGDVEVPVVGEGDKSKFRKVEEVVDVVEGGRKSKQRSEAKGGGPRVGEGGVSYAWRDEEAVRVGYVDNKLQKQLAQPSSNV